MMLFFLLEDFSHLGIYFYFKNDMKIIFAKDLRIWNLATDIQISIFKLKLKSLVFNVTEHSYLLNFLDLRGTLLVSIKLGLLLDYIRFVESSF